jgi:transporter family-2 protein
VSKEAAVAATIAAGGLVAVQAPVNNVLSRHVGTWGAASISFLVGTACVLTVAVAFAGGFQGDAGAASPAWYYWLLGGLAGATIVTTTLITVRDLGAGGVTAATIAGQLTAAVIVDHIGALGVERHPVTLARLAGIACLAAGTYLVVRR